LNIFLSILNNDLHQCVEVCGNTEILWEDVDELSANVVDRARALIDD